MAYINFEKIENFQPRFRYNISMDKQDQLSNQENELDRAFIADESQQPASDYLSCSQQRSVSGISFANTPNNTNFNFNQQDISNLQSWPHDVIQPFKVCPKRNHAIKQQNQSNSQEQNTEKYTKKRINQKMKVLNIKQNYESSSNYCLRRKKNKVKYNQNSSGEESQKIQLQFLVQEIKEKRQPITRSFKKQCSSVSSKDPINTSQKEI